MAYGRQLGLLHVTASQLDLERASIELPRNQVDQLPQSHSSVHVQHQVLWEILLRDEARHKDLLDELCRLVDVAVGPQTPCSVYLGILERRFEHHHGVAHEVILEALV